MANLRNDRRFEKNWNDDTIAALLKDQPQLAEGNNLEFFRRKWQYMFVHTAAAYSHAYTNMHYFTFVAGLCTPLLLKFSTDVLSRGILRNLATNSSKGPIF